MTDSPYLCTIKSKLLEDMSKIALGTWAWGAGAFGGDAVFGSKTDVENLKPVFDAAMKAGLNLWDTATVYGMGESEHILGTLAKAVKREDVQISTKFTPQLAEMFDNNVEKMADASIERIGCGYIDIYWIHNPMDVERWTPGLIPLLQSGKVKRVGVSNHNIKEIQRANEILGAAGFKVSAVQNHFSLLYRSSEKGGVTAIGQKYGASCSQIGIALAIAKGTLPIIGATKERHVIEAAEAAKIQLTAEEISKLEALADVTGIDTRGGWEHSME